MFSATRRYDATRAYGVAGAAHGVNDPGGVMARVDNPSPHSQLRYGVRYPLRLGWVLPRYALNYGLDKSFLNVLCIKHLVMKGLDL